MRISNLQIKNNFIGNVRRNYTGMSKVQQQLSTGKRIHRPSVDPMGAINSVYQRTQLARITQYRENSQQTKDLISYAHDKLGKTNDVLQQVRELAVRAGNSTFTQDDRKVIALEVEELLREAISNANGMYKDDYLFSGAEIKKRPFQFNETQRDGLDRLLISQVEYRGNNIGRQVEIDDSDVLSVSLAGNELFWGNQQTVVSLVDAAGYTAQTDQKIRIDGIEVELSAGDNAAAVIEKINSSVPSVRAFLQRLPDGRETVALETNSAHQMVLDDLEGGSALQDLGLITADSAGSGRNIEPNTMRSSNSIFDIIISLRDSLLEDNVENIGGRDLGEISTAMGNLLLRQAHLSAVSERLSLVDEKLAREEELTVERLAKNEDVDIAAATLNLKELENVHRVSLMTASRLIQPTLMDFLR